MKKGFERSLIVLVCLVFVLVFICAACKKKEQPEGADANTTTSGISIVSCEGTVYLEDASGNRTEIKAGAVIENGNILITEKGGTAVLSLNQEGTVYLEENTRLTVTYEGDAIDLSVSKGRILVDAKDKWKGIKSVTLHTDVLTADIQKAIVFLDDQSQENGSGNTVLGVLKGTTEISFTGPDKLTKKITEGQKLTVPHPNGDQVIQADKITESKISPDDLTGFDTAIKTADLSDLVKSIVQINEEKTDDSKKKTEENKNPDEAAQESAVTYYNPWQSSEVQQEQQAVPANPVKPVEPEKSEEPITTPVTFASGSASKVYDGTPLRDNTVVATGLPEGYSYRASCAGSITDAGSVENTIREIKIFDVNGKDVTGRFTSIVKIPGTLAVEPLELIVKTDSAEKVYDGTPLTAPGITIFQQIDGEVLVISSDGMLSFGEKQVVFTTTGSITEMGETDNTYYVNFDTIRSDNFTIKEELGKLNVLYIHIIAGSADKYYDGDPLESAMYEVINLPEGWAVDEVVTSGSQTDVGSSQNTITSYKLYDSEGTDVTEAYRDKVVLEDGILEVKEESTKLSVTIYGTVIDGMSMKVAFPELGATYKLENCSFRAAWGYADKTIDALNDDQNYSIAEYQASIKEALMTKGFLSEEKVEDGKIDGVIPDSSCDQIFDPGTTTSNSVNFFVVGGAVISKEKMQVIFPTTGEKFDLKNVTYNQAIGLAFDLFSEEYSYETEFQQRFKKGLQARGWI